MTRAEASANRPEAAPAPPAGLAAATHEPRSRWLEALDVASLVSFTGLWLALTLAVATGSGTADIAIAALLAVPAGLLVADLGSGVIHWLADTFFSESTPVLGRALIHPFREHHDDPLAITRHGFLEVTGNNGLVVALILAAALQLDLAGLWGAMFAEFVLVMTLAGLLTNQIHKWAHAPTVAAPVRWLQRRSWILDPAQHAQHHAPPHRGSYCVTGGWLNAVLDRVDIFSRIERAVRRLQGA